MFILGLVWTTFFAMGAGPAARAVRTHHREKPSWKQSYDRDEVEMAFGEGASEVADFARWGLLGCLLTFAGGAILAKSGAPSAHSPVVPHNASEG